MSASVGEPGLGSIVTLDLISVERSVCEKQGLRLNPRKHLDVWLYRSTTLEHVPKEVCREHKVGQSEIWWRERVNPKPSTLNPTSLSWLGFKRQHFTYFTCLSAVNRVESQRYRLLNSIQIPHAYSVSQPRPAYAYLCRNKHLTDNGLHGYIPVLNHPYALTLRQSAEMIEICPNQVHTGTPHIFCLTTTAIICVFV